MKSKSRRFPDRDANFLPSHLGAAFQSEFLDLMRNLSPQGENPSILFKYKYLKDEFMSKYCDSTTTHPDVRRAAAIEKWLTTEKRNRITNQRLLVDDVDFGWATSAKVLSFAGELIEAVLGPLGSIPKIANGTNGASTRIRRGHFAAIEKCTGQAHVSEDALGIYLIEGSGLQIPHELILQNSSDMFTVPKTSTIDRVACKEPEINMVLQRAVGTHIRSRLRRFGIDLNDQSVNRRLARIGVPKGLATVDLSAASDSITTQLVCRLLPVEWFVYLNRIRVHSTLIDGEVHELEMFSSMGNGFTFELESLIFWALTRSIAKFSGVKGTISVYGDDIICSCRIVPRLARFFHWIGLKVNPKKSAWKGKFRESCGGHYHGSLDVTPFYLREPVKRKTDVIRLLNRLLEWDNRDSLIITDPAISRFHAKWRKVIPESLWGGQNPESIYSLVTGHSPRKELVPANRPKRAPFSLGSGSLIHWLMTKEVFPEVHLNFDSGSSSRYLERESSTAFCGTTPWDIYLNFE